MKRTSAIILLAAAAVFGQNIDLSAWDKLAAKAKESSVVTLNPDTLALAASALGGDEGSDGKELKNLVGQMKSILIRSYEFAEKGMYTKEDVEAVRKQLGGPGWSKFMEVREKDELVEMWFHKGEKGSSGGLTILAAEPRELTFVHINGPGDLGSLMKASQLLKGSGVNLSNKKGGKARAPSKKEQDDEDDEDEN